MKIGLDIMGGDFAPKANVLGAIAAFQTLKPGQSLVLIGSKEEALQPYSEFFFYLFLTLIICVLDVPSLPLILIIFYAFEHFPPRVSALIFLFIVRKFVQFPDCFLIAPLCVPYIAAAVYKRNS